MSAGRGASISSVFPLSGWANLSRRACRACRSSSTVVSGRIAADFAPGDPRTAAVLPVAEDRTADVPQVHANLMRTPRLGEDADRRKPVEPLDDLVERLCRLPLGDRRGGWPSSRAGCGCMPIGSSIRSRSKRGLPTTSAKYSFSIVRSWNCTLSLPWARSFLATRISAAGVAIQAVDDARPRRSAHRAQLSAEVELQARWPACPTSGPAPDGPPSPGGLFTTASQSSS